MSAGKQGVLLAHSKDAGRYAEFATKSARKQGEVALVSSSRWSHKGSAILGKAHTGYLSLSRT